MPTDAHADALLGTLFDHAPVGLGFWDLERRYRRVNNALAAMNGIAPADHVGRTPSELLGQTGMEIEGILGEVIADPVARVDIDVEGQTPALPGQHRHWRASFYPVPGDHGGISGIGAVVVEVTGEREARRVHQTTTALLDAVFAAAPYGMAFWDLDFRYRRVNGAMAELNGVSAADHLGRRPSHILAHVGETVEEILAEVVARDEPVLDREFEATFPDGRRQIRHKTLFPVRDEKGVLVGVAGVVRDVTEQQRAEAERDRLLKEALTARAAAEAARVRAETARAEADAARRRTDFLARAGERLAVLTRDYGRTLQEVAWVAVPEMADWCTFTLLGRRGAPEIVAVASADPDRERIAMRIADRWAPRPGDPVGAGHVLQTGEPQLLQTVTDDDLRAVAHDDEHLELLRAAGLRSALIVPMKVRGRTIGALSLGLTGEREYEEDDVGLARSLAVRAALAVENARLYTERSHIAQTLQRSLLPPALPEVPGLELAARYRAAGDQNEVGGDFYDVFRGAEDGVWTILIGDVSGKGAEAAALTSLTRHTLRAASLRTGDPIESLKLLNEALWSQSDAEGRFCTVLYAQVRPDAHGAEVLLATGGHQPPVLLRAGGRVERLQLRGAIVGGLRDPAFGERCVHLEHGDTLVLFTDGVVELRRRDASGMDIGDRALEEVVAEHRGASPREIVEAVERRAVELQGGEPRDDIALIAIRPCP